MALHLASLVHEATRGDQILLNVELTIRIGNQLIARRQHHRSNGGEEEIVTLLKIARGKERVFVVAAVTVDSSGEATAVIVFEKGHGSVVHCVVAGQSQQPG